jgi:hypothetical protein
MDDESVATELEANVDVDDRKVGMLVSSSGLIVLEDVAWVTVMMVPVPSSLVEVTETEIVLLLFDEMGNGAGMWEYEEVSPVLLVL